MPPRTQNPLGALYLESGEKPTDWKVGTIHIWLGKEMQEVVNFLTLEFIGRKRGVYEEEVGSGGRTKQFKTIE
jgi:hypothetical protein